MTTFRYKGQTAGGAKVSGVLRAYDEFEAADKLRESVAIITTLEAVPEKKESVLSRPVAFRVKEKELALLCSQFAIILASGLSVERCVSMVAAQTKNKYLRRMLDKVSEEVGAGYSLAQSFENNAPYLPKTFTETLRAGEQSGTLESCFQRLHAYYDRSAKTRAKIVSTLTYPVMVIIVAIVVFVIIIAVAVPAFTDAFTDLGSGSLPGVTRALMAVSAFFTKWWWLVLGVLALLVIAYLTFRRTERGRAALAAWSLTRAPLRRIHSMNAAAQFAHSMATLLAAGLPLPRALEVTANVVSNYTFSLAVRQVRQDVERGRPMAESMAGIECFPAMLTEMVGVGERSGALEETLDVIGGYYDNEVSVTKADRTASVTLTATGEGEDRTMVTATYTAGGESFTSKLPLVLPVRMQGVLGIANTSGEPSVYWQGVMDRDGTAFTDDVPSGAPYTDRPAYAGAKLYLYSRGSAATFDGLSVSGVTVKGGADATEYVLRPMPVSNDEDTSVLHPDVFRAENDDFRVTVGTPAKDTTSAFTYRPLTVKGRSQGQITLTVTLTDAENHAFTLSIPYTLTEEDTRVTATLRVDEQAFTLSVPYGTALAAEALSQLLTDNGISPDTIDSWTPDITQPLYADTAFTAVRKTADSGGAPTVPDADTPASGSRDPEDTPSDDPSAPDSSSSGTDPTPEPSPDTLP